MEQLLQEIFDEFCLGDRKTTTPQYRAQAQIVNKYHTKVTTAFGQTFSEDMWCAHSKLSELEMQEAFRLGLRLSAAITNGFV